VFTPGFSGVHVTRSLVLYVCFVDRCLSRCTFSFVHYVNCSSSFQANDNDIIQMFEKAMCWAPEGKIITFKEWKEDLGGTPNGKPW
jgi:hypothetical protein